MSDKADELALMAILTSLVVAATALYVPMPGFRIYFNLGEGIIYIIALTWGSRYGAMCGGLGASLADLLLGHPLGLLLPSRSRAQRVLWWVTLPVKTATSLCWPELQS